MDNLMFEKNCALLNLRNMQLKYSKAWVLCAFNNI